jgi:nicotinate-nucleotide pyrophosphorylase (carboxylating)
VISNAILDPIIDRALIEDLAGGDLTSELTVDPDTPARAVAIARTDLVVCGAFVFARVFERLEPSVKIELHEAEGTRVENGRALWSVQGTARALLAAERTALNFVQRMSGIATNARAYVDALPRGSSTTVADTRKTTPGLRVLERYAVRTGGAHSHRDNLGSAVLIKDNHIVAAGGIAKAVERARKGAPHTSRIEVEVENLDELDIALESKADIILLDNFPLDDLKQAVRKASGRAILEASGGITLESIAKIASTGVNVISVGALTHSAPAADIALDLDLLSE